MNDMTTLPKQEAGSRQRQEVEQIQDLFIGYYSSLLAFACRYVARDAAEDLVQDVFARLWERHDGLSRVADPSAYLYQMVRHRCLNHLRHERVKGLVVKRYLSEWQGEEIDAYIEEEAYRRLLEAIDELPPACHAILSLGLQGCKASEIADRLNIAISTVKKQKQIARRILRRKLGMFLIFAGSFGLKVFKVFS
ncbi:MAG: RNA polymerase sigma-70 factor [Odoribacteraceae bacterium]|jgi:RNA polymerase sigma-70 factor (ECF subfamily)|nr:RNA polymerase sigma-70 factor [Odoribacteraceae bacterium]